MSSSELLRHCERLTGARKACFHARIIIGFQGESGAFSEEAALALLGPEQTRGYRTFDDLVAAVDGGEVRFGLLPCENSIAGSIARAYDLLSMYANVRILDETTHRIEQCLIGTPGSTLAGVRTVHSHPVALEQCRSFLAEHSHWGVAVADDTAGAVREIVQRDDEAAAAIGPALAAHRYGGRILQRGIEDDADNTTRFFLIGRDEQPRRSLGRACLAVSLPHEAGSLHRALGVFAQHGVNLRSLVARPNRVRPFEYVFYVEVDIAPLADLQAIAQSISPMTRILGRY